MTPQEQEAFHLGRLQGLKEMDLARDNYESARAWGIGDSVTLPKLRAEYKEK
jgi:hypothetical protein